MLALIGFMGFCLLVGMASGGITQTSVRTWYPSLTAPPGTPPNWVFPVVWTALYLMMGLSAWLVWRRLGPAPSRGHAALRLWGWQLLLNALWTPAFFGARSTGLGLVVILPLLAAVLLTVRAFWRMDRVAAALLLPYAAWVSYATYLNFGFWWLNGG